MKRQRPPRPKRRCPDCGNFQRAATCVHCTRRTPDQVTFAQLLDRADDDPEIEAMLDRHIAHEVERLRARHAIGGAA